MFNRILIGGICVTMLLVLIQLMQIAVFDGHYNLTVCIENEAIAEDETLRMMVAGNEQTAVMLQKVGLAEWNQDHVSTNELGCRVIPVPFAGRSNVFGQVTSYIEFRHLVIGFEAPEGTHQFNHLVIPPGRGDRNMHLQLEVQNLTP